MRALLHDNRQRHGHVAGIRRAYFDPFERSEEVSIARIQGTGLGMSITKALIDAMGGIVEVDSEKGRGSSFRVTLELRVVSSADACPPLEVVPESTSYRFEARGFSWPRTTS